MREYLIFRTLREFDDMYDVYHDLFSKWETCWNNREIHDQLYSCYVRLKIVSVLIRNCIDYKLIENINLKTKNNPVSLKTFCDYCIHHKSCFYTSGKDKKDNLSIYLNIKTDTKEEVSFIINNNLMQIKKALNCLRLVV